MGDYAAWVTPERAADDQKNYPVVEGGHVWYRDDGLVDMFRVESGFHNGPECARCHESFCEHCEPDRLIEKCPEFGTALPGLDVANDAPLSGGGNDE